MSEWMIQDFAKVSKLRYVILRYFNGAGADSSGKLGQRTENATHLIRMACDAALGRRPALEIFGTDFPTLDSTAIRDYIHVEDLATAHLDALKYLENGELSQVLNCGYGEGYSVRQVIYRVKAIFYLDFPVVEVQRRSGDPPWVVSNSEKIFQVLGWQPQHNDLDIIIRTALSWEIAQKSKSDISKQLIEITNFS